MTDKVRVTIDPSATSAIIPGLPAGVTATVTAYTEDVYGQVSDPVSDTVDTPVEQVDLTDPVSGIPILTTQTNPGVGVTGAQPFLSSEWRRGTNNGGFYDPPPTPLSPIDNTTNPLPGWELTASGGITAYWVDGRVDFHIPAASTGDANISQRTAVRSSATRNNVVLPVAAFSVDIVPASSHYGVLIQTQEYDRDLVLLGSGAGTTHDLSTVLTTPGDIEPGSVSQIRADTVWVVVTVGVVHSTTPLGVDTVVSLYDLTLVSPPPLTVFPNLIIPTSDAGIMGIDTLSDRVSLNTALAPADLVLPPGGPVTTEGWVRWNTATDRMTVGAGGGVYRSIADLADIPATPFGTPNLTLGTANAAGAASTVIRSDATILAFDATTPAAVGTAAVGAATVAARRDHVHATGAGTPTTSAVGDSAATGTGPAAAMTNHVHGRESFGSTAAAIGASAGGSATTPSHSDHVHATGAGTPTTSAVGDAAATGTGPAAAMTNHVHGREAFGTTAAAIGTSAGGSATTPSHSDHVHATGAGTPAAVSTANATGSGPAAAMTDHVHAHEAAHINHDTTWAAKGDVIAGTANDTAAVLTVGADDTILMADAAQTTGLKWVASATPSTQAFGDAAAVGTADTFTRGDHKHAMPAAPTASSVGASANPHGAADHTDITRHFFLWAADAKLDSGTAATLGTAPDAIPAVAFADAATQGCYWARELPIDYASGTLSVRPIWAPGSTDASSHAVRWSVDALIFLNATDVTSAGTTTAYTGVAAARSANLNVGTELDTDIGVTPSFIPQGGLRLNIRRVGGNAADTYVGTVNLLGVRVTYTANQ